MRLSRRTFTVSSAVILSGLGRIPTSAQVANVYTFAVLGLDRHTGDGSQRADTIMISRVDLEEVTVRTLSIPRDLFVEVPGYGSAKINHGYQHGLEMDPELKWQSGAASAVATITHNFGIEIDGVAVLEFERMPELIDSIGGIQLDNPYAFSDGGYDYEVGPITLNGAETTYFVRSRRHDGDGGRVMRQHLVLAAILQKLQQPEILPRVADLVKTLSDVVHTDISVEVQLQLMAAIPSIQPENLAFTNIEDLLWADYTPGGAWIYQADWSTLPKYVDSWLDGGPE